MLDPTTFLDDAIGRTADDHSARPGLPPRGAVDERDLPAPSPFPEVAEVPALLHLGDDRRPELDPQPAALMRPFPTRHGAARIIRARTVTIPSAAGSASVLLGLEPGAVQAQNVHYLMLLATPGAGSLVIAGREDATPLERFTVPVATAGGVAVPLQLPGVAGVYAWAATADVTVSLLVVGEAN